MDIEYVWYNPSTRRKERTPIRMTGWNDYVFIGVNVKSISGKTSAQFTSRHLTDRQLDTSRIRVIGK